jgi:hypothetical protein
MRNCSKCNKTKSFDKFYKRSASATPYMATPEARYEKICKECRKQHMKDNFRAYNYGISEDQYKAMLEQQEGRCAICQELPKSIALHVDHDHVTGNVRGLLCRDCNLAIGHLRDSTSILMRAIKYLENYR